MDTIAYHLSELEIARNPADPDYCMPDIRPDERVLVDIGCGIGQLFLTTDMNNRIGIGVDIDPVAVRYGIEHHGDRINFMLSNACNLPLPSKVADLVVSRVSLAYTNIPKTIKEIRRVLKPGGRLWVTLHPREMIEGRLRNAIRKRYVKDTLRQFYVLANGHLFAQAGVLLPFLTGEYESWQDTGRLTKVLEQNGFEAEVRHSGKHVIVEGILGDKPAR